MSELLVYFIFTIILNVLVLFFYILKRKEKELNIIDYYKRYYFIKYVIISLIIILIIIFCIRIEIFTLVPTSLAHSTLLNFSLTFLVTGIILLIKTYYILPNYIIDLDYPSRTKSKIGTIKLGRILDRNRSKHQFFLNLTDLAQHMFVCGITGTGKSNLIQYFLINFTKCHKMPFLLTEFKGEYHFLQTLIEDLLILKPGENFSINIFDPEGIS